MRFKAGIPGRPRKRANAESRYTGLCGAGFRVRGLRPRPGM